MAEEIAYPASWLCATVDERSEERAI